MSLSRALPSPMTFLRGIILCVIVVGVLEKGLSSFGVYYSRTAVTTQRRGIQFPSPVVPNVFQRTTFPSRRHHISAVAVCACGLMPEMSTLAWMWPLLRENVLVPLGGGGGE